MNSYSSAEQSESESSYSLEALFQKKSKTIATSIQKIHQNVTAMQRMVNQMGTAQDSPDLKSQLHQIRTYTQQLIKDTDTLLNELVTGSDRHLKIQRERLVDEFTAALTSFQNVQKKTVDMEKHAFREARAQNVRINRPPTGSKASSNSSNKSTGGGSGFDDSFMQGTTYGGQSGLQTQTQLQQEEIDLQALQDHERTIRELEENIVGVNEIYKKLGAMVYEQGATIDSIETAVENTNVFVHDGTEQLRQASKYQTKLRKKKLCFALIGAVVLAIFIAVLWSQFN